MTTCYKFDFNAGDISYDKYSKKMNNVSEDLAVVQDAVTAIKTYISENVFYTDFGSRVGRILGEPLMSNAQMSSILKEAVLKDARYRDINVEESVFDVASGKLTLKVKLSLANNEDYIIDTSLG